MLLQHFDGHPAQNFGVAGVARQGLLQAAEASMVREAVASSRTVPPGLVTFREGRRISSLSSQVSVALADVHKMSSLYYLRIAAFSPANALLWRHAVDWLPFISSDLDLVLALSCKPWLRRFSQPFSLLLPCCAEVSALHLLSTSSTAV
ncbi:unnamed protein product [Polarella glacialis]|uniref:Uncharacterized protein n=1 Tax=Polarella glacialis TaxID=89957 RepID=A0A813FDV6_POLGL|nr:unnamed protein product [Polarella glacialis]